MLHCLDRGVKLPCLSLSDHLGKILEHQASRSIRPLAPKLREIVAHTAADIDEENIILCDIGKQAGHVVETNIHPARASLVVDRHVVVKLASGLWVLFHELEEVKISSESALEGALLAVSWVGIAVLLELGR